MLTKEVRQLARAILKAVLPIELRTRALDNWAHLVAQAEFDIEHARAAQRDLYRRLRIQNASVMTRAKPHPTDADPQNGDLHVPASEVSTEMIGQAVNELRTIHRYEKCALSRCRKAALTFRSHMKQLWKRSRGPR